jgi:dephospho-CoA kinase
MKQDPRIYLIGLTGGIACGKSTVLATLAGLGAQTIDADKITHRVQQPGMPVYQQIVATFGDSILTANGSIDRRKLGAIVFNDNAALQQLEALVHPAVRSEIGTWIEQVAQAGGRMTRLGAIARPVAVIDAIKLIESGWPAICDAVWVVTCQPEQQVERLVRTRGMNETEARQRIAAQPPQEQRLAHATVVIDNSGSQEQTRTQIEDAWQQILDSVRG